jgi:hypothetical protein
MSKNKTPDVKILDPVEDSGAELNKLKEVYEQLKADPDSTLLQVSNNDIMLTLESLAQRLGAVEAKVGIGLPEPEVVANRTVILQGPGSRDNLQDFNDPMDKKIDRYQEIQEQRQALINKKGSKYIKPKTANTVDLNSRLRSLVGSHLGMVQTTLTNMKIQGTIGNFQVVPIGTPAPVNSMSGRVIVTVDHNSNVLDIYVG